MFMICMREDWLFHMTAFMNEIGWKLYNQTRVTSESCARKVACAAETDWQCINPNEDVMQVRNDTFIHLFPESWVLECWSKDFIM